MADGKRAYLRLEDGEGWARKAFLSQLFGMIHLSRVNGLGLPSSERS